MINDMMERDNIQKMQDGFAGLADILIFCVDEEGNMLTKVSGNVHDAERMLELIGKQQL